MIRYRLWKLLVCLAFCAIADGCVTQSALQAAHGEANMFTSHSKKAEDIKPNPAYYALLPLTLPADVVATPVILVILYNQDWAP